METNPLQTNPDDPRAALTGAAEARGRLAAGLRLPAGMYPALAAAVAIQLGTAAYGIADQTTGGLAVALGGVAVFYGMAVLALRQFRRINGVRVDGLNSQIVLGAWGTPTVAYLFGFGGAMWAAFESRWWLVVVVSVAGGAGYAFSLLRWWRAYQQDPAARAGGPSPRVLAVLAGLAFLGLVALMLAS
jgi:hypothetical protein